MKQWLLARLPFLWATLQIASACAQTPAALGPPRPDAPIAELAIRNVTVIDGTGAAPQTGRTVLVNDARISEIAKGSPDGRATREIDGRGRFLIPGLIDAHCHPAPPGPVQNGPELNKMIFEPMVRFGVTTAVLYGGSRGSYASMVDLARQSEQGELNAPRILFSSPIVTIEGGHPVRTYTSNAWIEGETILIPRSLADIDAIVADTAKRPAIGVKITVEDGPAPPFIEPMPAAWVQRFVQKGNELGVPIYAHVSDMAEVRTCVEAGVHALVHYWGVELDQERDAPVIDSMLAQDISWITTLALGKGMVFYPQHREWLEREVVQSNYAPELLDVLRTHGSPDTARALLETWTGDPDMGMDDFFAADVAGIAEANRRGVNMVLGTDMGNDFVLPGLALHEEMEILQVGGMRPLDILRMGTHNAAKMLGRADLGTILVGKRADLVLLAADPTTDIANTLSIERVFIDGVER